MVHIEVCLEGSNKFLHKKTIAYFAHSRAVTFSGKKKKVKNKCLHKNIIILYALNKIELTIKMFINSGC